MLDCARYLLRAGRNHTIAVCLPPHRLLKNIRNSPKLLHNRVFPEVTKMILQNIGKRTSTRREANRGALALTLEFQDTML